MRSHYAYLLFYIKFCNVYRHDFSYSDSDNDAPMFSVDQKFVVFLFEHGGEDAGCYQFKDAKQTFFMIMQVCLRNI